MKRLLTFHIFLILCYTLLAQSEAPQSYPPSVSQGELLGVIPALRDLTPQTSLSHAPYPKGWKKSNYFFSNEIRNHDAQPKGGDPLAIPKNGTESSGPQLQPGFNIEGLRDPFGVSPPDPTGDVGKNHYVQMVNTSGGSWFQVWDKNTGESVYGPALTSTIWDQVNSGSIGDPVIQYDPAAERWLMMEMKNFSENALLVAISDDSDPTGGWKAYSFQTVGFPDYPKLFVWNNAYMVTTNEIVNSNVCSGFALERSALLAGAPTFKIYRFVMPNFGGIRYQPAICADWEGGPPPPANSPGYIFRMYDDSWNGGADQLQIWEVNINWSTPGSSNISGPKVLYPAPFESRVCFGQGLFDCIEQPGGNQAPRLTALENILMYKAPYRNFGSHESVVFNQISDVSGQEGDGGDAAARWYELRKEPGGDWNIYQQSTYAPDLTINRFMGNISQDERGNIALGYSRVGPNTYPGLGITGRRLADPLNLMSIDEYILATGQTNHANDSRWGDYCSMSVDPVDGKTFWFTGEYQPSGADWGTRIGSFQIVRDPYDITPRRLISPVSSALLSNAEQVKVSIFNGGLNTATNITVSLQIDGVPIATENVPGPIAPDSALVHTFAPTVSFATLGQNYQVRVVAKWQEDIFDRNDTLYTTVTKLTSNDAQIAGVTEMSGLVCGTAKEFGLILRNASGLPMTSARIFYRPNINQPYTIYDWTGNLAPGRRDTIPLSFDGIVEGLNGFAAYSVLPNGQSDQFTANDTLKFKFYGNLDGNYLTAVANTKFGLLNWELRSLSNSILASGQLSQENTFDEICTEDETCYKLRLKSATLAWEGNFKLLDIFGNTLAETTVATNEVAFDIFNFCTPERFPVDAGAWNMVGPNTSTDLGSNEPVTARFRNFGLTELVNPEFAWRLDNGAWHTETYNGTLAPAQTVEYTFQQTADLSEAGRNYQFEFRTNIANDAQPENDTIIRNVMHLHQLDAWMTDLGIYSGCTPGDTMQIKAIGRNNGQNAIERIVLQTTINDVYVRRDTFDFTNEPIPSLYPFELQLEVDNLVAGVNKIDMAFVEVNGVTSDDAPNNSFLSKNVTVEADAYEIILTMQPDANPQEIRWEILDDSGNVVAEGGPLNLSATLLYTYCLKKDACFTFRVYDTGGNGIADPGLIIIYGINDGKFIYQNAPGNFGSVLDIPFCTYPPCATYNISAEVTPVSSPGATDGSILIHVQNGTPPFTYYIQPGGVFQEDSLFSNLPAGEYLVYAGDVNSCSQQIVVNISTVGVNDVATRIVKASPNPTTGLVWLEMSALEGEQYAICDVFHESGQILRSVRMARWDDTLRGALSLEKQPAGTYLIKVRGNRQQRVVKVVKQ
ncbi:MAG: hypothetical protein IT269_02905 [Saprospiraceae bacterium]|nr:hypothetical protein [Saprospiraceae bacterium]